MKTLSRIVPTIFMLVVAGVAALVLWRVGFKDLPGPSPTDKHTIADYNRCVAEATASGSLDVKVLKQCADDLAKDTIPDDYGKSRMDEMRWMLTIIGSLAAFFVVAQSASAYFAAQSYSRTADEAIARIKEQEAAVRARYPLFEQVRETREIAYQDLRNALSDASKVGDPSADPLEALTSLEHFYEKMPVDKRQRLLSIESFVSLDLAPGSPSPDSYPTDLVRLGVFYQSKFLYENGLGRGLVADMERAEIYLRLAYSQSQDFTVLNELGHFFTNCHKAYAGKSPLDFLAMAEKQFELSLDSEPRQQRAHYDLAVIQGRYRKDFEKAIRALKNALNHKNWQRLPVKYAESLIHYTLGCYYARKLNESNALTFTEGDAVDLLESLQNAASFGLVPKNNVNFDFKDPKGDFAGVIIRADPQLQVRMSDIRATLSNQIDLSLTPSQALAEAVKIAKRIPRIAKITSRFRRT